MSTRYMRRAGFTLTEVLVASMLLSMVMTAVYSLFYSVLGTWRSEENDEGLHRKARSLITLLEKDYGNLHSGGASLFEGAGDEVTLFVVAQPMDVETGEGRRLMKVRYHFDRANGTVVRDEAVVSGALPATTASADELEPSALDLSDESSFVVATGVSRFELRYLWVERPSSAYWRERPVPVEPVAVERHRPGWGLPQALQIDLTLSGAREDTVPLELQIRIPTRSVNRQRDAWELARMLEDKP